MNILIRKIARVNSTLKERPKRCLVYTLRFPGLAKFLSSLEIRLNLQSAKAIMQSNLVSFFLQEKSYQPSNKIPKHFSNDSGGVNTRLLNQTAFFLG